MTYRELLWQIQSLSEEQLDREIILYDWNDNLLLDNEVTKLGVAQCDCPGLISMGTPYLTFVTP